MDPSNKLHLGCQLSVNSPRKRKWTSEDPEEPSKKRRKTLSLSQGLSQTAEDSKTVKPSRKRKLEDSEERKDVKRIKLSSSQQTVKVPKTVKANRKRKREDSEERKDVKKMKLSSSQQTVKVPKTVKPSRKRKHEDSEERNDVKRIKLSSSQQTVEDSKTVQTGRKSSRCSEEDCKSMDCLAPPNSGLVNPCEGTSDGSVTISTDRQSRTVFNDTYKQEKKIGQGGFGFVFAGYRKCDHLPVALKWTQFQDVIFTVVSEHGKEALVPQEVALLLALKDVPAVVTLLDWYQLDSEVVLVLERPEKCLNLSEYIASSGGFKEPLVKIIMQQLVDAFAEIHFRGVFHSDIKLENILIDFSPKVTRFRIIDFGCGSFLKSGENKEPVTVSQIGLVLSNLLQASLANGWEITKDCQDFLSACLREGPKIRPSLYELQHHPWLNPTN